jgi:putative MFS transporter
MIGMLLGGIIFGLMGDRKGRLAVLFSSIALYSIANILNGLVHTLPQYILMRFLAGLGLAGELGAGITLVAELLPKNKRGIGTAIVASIGVAGALFAATLADHFGWRSCYFIGGGLGVALLGLRIGVRESGIFDNLKSQLHVKRGDLRLLLAKPERVKRFIYCILPGLPIWFVLGILVTFGPEILKEKMVPEVLKAGRAVFYVYVGFVSGDLLSGLVSQYLESRKKTLYFFITMVGVGCVALLKSSAVTLEAYYAMYVFLGFFSGYWAVFVTVAAEQFGTNLRATVATSVPNFIRGSTVLLTLGLEYMKPQIGVVNGALVLALVTTTIAALSVSQLSESFGRDLDFNEH